MSVHRDMILICFMFFSLFFFFSMEFLRHMRDFFQVMFKLDVEHLEHDDSQTEQRRGADKVILTCVGVGFRNLSKVIS